MLLVIAVLGTHSQIRLNIGLLDLRHTIVHAYHIGLYTYTPHIT